MNYYINQKTTILLLFVLLILHSIFFSFTAKLNPNNSDKIQTYSDTVTDDKIIIIGDTQHKSFLEYFLFRENNVNETKLLLKEIAMEEPKIILHLGDITSFGSSENQWENYDEDSKPIQDKNIQVYPVFGNHDYYGDNEICYTNFYNHFPQIKNKKWYSFIKFGTSFIMLNSNFSELTDDEIKEQNKWYRNQLDSLDKDTEVNFIIVCTHHPPYTNSTVVNPDEEVKKYFAKPFQKCKKGTIFFSGHCHTYERFIEEGKYFIVSGGGGGPRQKLNTDKKTRLYNDLFEGPAIRFFHFCELDIKNDSMQFKVKKLNDDNSFSIAEELVIKRLN